MTIVFSVWVLTQATNLAGLAMTQATNPNKGLIEKQQLLGWQFTVAIISRL